MNTKQSGKGLRETGAQVGNPDWLDCAGNSLQVITQAAPERHTSTQQNHYRAGLPGQAVTSSLG